MKSILKKMFPSYLLFLEQESQDDKDDSLSLAATELQLQQKIKQITQNINRISSDRKLNSNEKQQRIQQETETLNRLRSELGDLGKKMDMNQNKQAKKQDEEAMTINKTIDSIKSTSGDSSIGSKVQTKTFKK